MTAREAAIRAAATVRETATAREAATRAAETVRETAVFRAIVRETVTVRPEAATRAAETAREAAISRAAVPAAVSSADGARLPEAGRRLTRTETADAPLEAEDPDRAISSGASSRAARALPRIRPARTMKSIEKKKRDVSARRRISATARIICMRKTRR